MSRGWWTIARFRGAPLRLHWTLPLGALAWGHFQFLPAFWLGFVLLILIHELGHALLVLRYRLGLAEIAVHGAGGYCRHEHAGSPFQEAAIAWGGVLAQLAAFAICQIALWIGGPPTSASGALLASVFTTTNLWLIAFNLLPVEPLDGAKAWPLIPLWWAKRTQRAPARGAWGRRSSVADELRSLEHQDAAPGAALDQTERIVRDLISRTTQAKSKP